MARQKKNVFQQVIGVFGSFGMVCIILLLLLLLTFLGTLEQQYSTLYEVQKRYFESLFVTGTPLRVPLPGAYLLLSVLALNLLVGGMLRMRRSWSRAGVFIIHIGIAMLLVAGFVEWRTSQKGQLRVLEGSSGDSFLSSQEWDVVVTEHKADGSARQYTIPNDRLRALEPGAEARMVSDELPFDVILSGYLPNCSPRPVDDGFIQGIVVEGFVLQPKPGPDTEGSDDFPGVACVIEEDSGQRQVGLLWGRQRVPWALQIDGRTWEVDLRRREWDLPFTIRLTDFTKEEHPGITRAAKYYSDVVYIENGVEQNIRISMNEPLRRQGYTVYQSGFQPTGTGPDDPFFSSFSVVLNPTDQVPKWACWVIALGLLVHFIPMLTKHIKAQSAKASS